MRRLRTARSNGPGRTPPWNVQSRCCIRCKRCGASSPFRSRMAISVDSALANDELEAQRVPRTDVFIVGAPRSGTTFLQNLIGSHPLVASSQETDLFTQYVGPWRTSWEHQLRSDPESWKRWRHKGLPAVLTEQEFDSIVGGVVDHVHSRTVGLKPGAMVCLIKVPQDCRRAELILRYLPNARFIHL